MNGEPAGEFVGEVAGEGWFAEFRFAVEVLDEFESVLADEPVAEAAVFPFGEILFGDRAGVEVVGERLLDWGEGVEPGENGFGGLAGLEALVELVANGVRKTGDFAGARGRGVESVHDVCFWF